MTISSQTSRIEYTGNSSTAAFSVPFYFAANSDIVVYVTTTAGVSTLQVEGTHYTLTGATLAAGGTVTFITAPTTAYSIVIYRDPTLTQTTSYNNNDPFPAKSHELALDKALTIEQRTRDLVTRSIHLSDFDTVVTTTIPLAAARASKALGFSETGAVTVINPVGATGISGGTTQTFLTRAQAISSTISTSLDSITINRYTTLGPYFPTRYVPGTVSGPGALQEVGGHYWQIDVTSGFLNALSFGAFFDGSTDDTTAIAAAIAATPSGGTLLLPAGTAKIAGSSTAIFTITTPIHIIGSGQCAQENAGTILKLATGVPNTRDVFHIVGVTDVVHRGYTFKDFGFSIVSGTGGKSVFNFDTTAGTTTGFAEVLIDSISMPASVSAGNVSVLVNNGIGTNTNGGTFNFTVQKCYIAGGITFAQAGDTLRVYDNIITGTHAGIQTDQVSGAGDVVIMGNNITSSGGAIIVGPGIAPIIAFNEIESGVTTEANNAVVDIIGAGVESAKFFGNQVQVTTGTATCLRVASSTSAFIDGNRFSTPSGTCIVNTATATGTVIGLGNEFTGTRLSEAGTGTIDPGGAWVTYTSTFASSTGTATVAAKKKVVGKTIFVNIKVTFTAGVTGTFSVTLPAASLNDSTIMGKEIALTGVGAHGNVAASATTLSVVNSAGAQFTTINSVILLTGSYEST